MSDILVFFASADTVTLMKVLCWTNLVSVIVNLLYWATIRDEGSFSLLKLYSVAKVCQLVTFTFILVRGMAPDLLTYFVSNSLFIIAMYAEAICIYEVLGIRTPGITRVLTAILVASLLYYNIGEYYHPDGNYRIISASVGPLFLIIVPSLHLLFGRKSDIFNRVMGAFYMLFCISVVVRILAVAADGSLSVFSDNAALSLVFIALINLNTLSSALLFLSLKISLDETNRLREKELIQSAHAAQEANRIKTTFLATMSHEIRTPLNAILGLTELTKAEDDLPEKLRGRLDRVDLSARSLLQIINDILDISKVESGKIELEKIPFALGEVFDICRVAVEPKAREKGLKLLFRSEPPPGKKLLGDPTRLRQVLMNLLSNAVKFTDQGIVRLTVLTDEQNAGDARLYFEVKDTGIGMTADQLRKIFDPFTQADSSVTRKFGGTGLGLAIAKNIVQLMGGSLEATSEPGCGSAFFFRLSFDTVDAREDEVHADDLPSAPVPQFAGDVLVCEDNEINQEVIVENLKRLGLAVSVAANGAVGVDMARARLDENKPYDLILMDIQMPVMSGLEAAAALEDMGNPSPIVALTANIMATDQETYVKSGIEGCLAKPFSAAELHECLRRFLTELPPDSGAAPALPTRESARATATPEASVVDRARGLALAAGNAGLYARMCRNFVTEQENAHADVAEAIVRGDVDGAVFRVHALKGVAGMIGAGELSGAAEELERFLRSGEDDAEKRGALLDRFGGCLEEAVAALQEK